ncbi:MAG: molybdenum cofactor biosynthesis protein MoaE [Methylococcales bacterium]|jgi:molybdopterin synthase catalytic subunit|nr:molybdenum cofactor biosynthesis protein MoaE [Methylococcales bacterium]
MIHILTEPFDPWQVLADYQKTHIDGKHSYGATGVFVGTMRDFNDAHGVQQMELSHYPGMTEKQTEKIINRITDEWDVLDVLVCHRVGVLLPSDPIVMVAVWSHHRVDAFEVSRAVMEKLKSEAPFWKKEVRDNSDKHWVEKNTAGYKGV